MFFLELFFIISLQIVSIFTFESVLDSTIYNIKWHDSMDLKNELNSVPTDRMSVVMKTNKNEKYQCLLPTNTYHHKEEASSGVKLELELLGALIKSSYCSYRIETYWSYELCQGKTVRQFHEHLKPISTQQYILGNYTIEKYEADLLKARVERQLGTATKSVRKKKVYGLELAYYEVTYTDGTVCDLTGLARQTHVQYVCHEDGGGELYDIKETSSCEYEAVVLTKDLCQHPSYGNQNKKVLSIDCHPLVKAPALPSNLNQLMKEDREAKYDNHKTRLVDSLWDVVYKLADEEDEEEIRKIEAKTLGRSSEDSDDDSDDDADDADDDADDEQQPKLSTQPSIEQQQQQTPQQQKQQTPQQQQQQRLQQQQQQRLQQQQKLQRLQQKHKQLKQQQTIQRIQQQQKQQQQQQQQQRLQQQQQQQEKQQQTPQQQAPLEPLPNVAYKSILEAFLSGQQCISGGTGWWKHEICHKRFVKQFHPSEDVKARREVQLGKWSEEGHLEWTKHTNKKTKHTTGRKFIYNFYGEGDFCEESGKRRVVEVRLECLDVSNKGIMIYMLEPSVCVYELVVQSHMFCEVIDSANSNGLINYP